MSTTDVGTGRPQLAVMARLEARRFARHPLFLVAVVLAYGLTVLAAATEDEPYDDTLSTPVLPAFFIGLLGIVVAARLTRSTETAAEAVGTAPGTEATRTAALCLASLVPFTAGAGWVVLLLGLTQWRGVARQDWWFATMPDVQVWSLLLALGPVACAGGALLGVLTGRWLRFPGAPALVVLVTLAVCVGSMFPAQEGPSVLRLVVPWAAFGSGTNPDGTTTLFGGNAPFYLLYLLCLCAAAALTAMWHDRTARTRRLRSALAGVVVIGLVSLALAMTTGPDQDQRSEPMPWKVEATG